MTLKLDKNAANKYKSLSQRARVLTEAWVRRQMFCPNCGQIALRQFHNNKPVADFYCESCSEEYELKSKQGKSFGRKVSDGAYKEKMRRLRSNTSPNLFLLNYDAQRYDVSNFLVVPKQFFIPKIIERRKPLAPTARRAGWIGSNILLDAIPQSGRVYVVKNNTAHSKDEVCAEWRKTLFLREEKDAEAKGWLLDVMGCVEKIGKREFSLDEVYAHEDYLSKLHPDNKHVKDKIRQQLQVLRDKGYLVFQGRGQYQLV